MATEAGVAAAPPEDCVGLRAWMEAHDLLRYYEKAREIAFEEGAEQVNSWDTIKDDPSLCWDRRASERILSSGAATRRSTNSPCPRQVRRLC